MFVIILPVVPIDWSRDLVLRWHGSSPFPEALAKQAGIDAIVEGPPEFAVTRGLWPGVRQPPNSRRSADDVASASNEPWIDSNAWQVAYRRALEPRRIPVLAYEPKLEDRMVGFETLETALIETRVMGGNFLLTLEPRYERSLLAGDTRATAAWTKLGQTARWLKEHSALFGKEAIPTVTVLAEPGSAEIVNLLFRRGASPWVVSSREPPLPSGDIKVLVAAGIRAPDAKAAARILAHAREGGTVALDGAWWKPESAPARSQKDRDFFHVGRGSVILYRNRIADPSEFALDMLDVITHRARAVRIWNATAVIPVTRHSVAYLINYGEPAGEREIQVRFQGRFRRANILRPDAPAASVEPKPRGSMSEVFVSGLDRVSVIEFG
jgi:hypothetical protein